MKFLKSSSINRYSPTNQSLFVNSRGRSVMNGTRALKLPEGDQNSRPQLTNIRYPGGDNNGYIRYNTTTGSLEAYLLGAWTVVKAPATAAVTKQTLGPGDYSQTIFGPLTVSPSQDDSLIVLVENVMQISVTNFSVLYNYQGSGNAYIQFTEPPPLGKYVTVFFGFA